MEHKIIFTGPVGAGKTTATGTVSDIPVVRTEAGATDEVALRKATTTVAMDYGMLILDDATRIHLYGTPGQERFSFMWEILSEGAMGVVLLLDNHRPDPIQDMRFYLDAFKRPISTQGNAVVIGVTHMDKMAEPTLEHYQSALANLGLNVPVFEVDPRQRQDVKNLLLALTALLDPRTRRGAARG